MNKLAIIIIMKTLDGALVIVLRYTKAHGIVHVLIYYMN